uniref:Uncharacterized protein n=1 Tax=Ciona intestinalis TaxID=7719 RepID=F6TTV2_CIOIN
RFVCCRIEYNELTLHDLLIFEDTHRTLCPII